MWDLNGPLHIEDPLNRTLSWLEITVEGVLIFYLVLTLGPVLKQSIPKQSDTAPLLVPKLRHDADEHKRFLPAL